jgi:hypothetical protein
MLWSKSDHVSVDGDSGEASFDDGASVVVLLAEEDVSESGSFETKVESSDAREERSGSPVIAHAVLSMTFATRSA